MEVHNYVAVLLGDLLGVYISLSYPQPETKPDRAVSEGTRKVKKISPTRIELVALRYIIQLQSHALPTELW